MIKTQHHSIIPEKRNPYEVTVHLEVSVIEHVLVSIATETHQNANGHCAVYCSYRNLDLESNNTPLQQQNSYKGTEETKVVTFN